MSQEYNGEIQLLVTDVVMPQIDGKMLAERVKTMHPNTKILFISGYTEEAILQHGVLESGAAFIQKPFLPSTQVCKVRAVLDETRQV